MHLNTRLVHRNRDASVYEESGSRSRSAGRSGNNYSGGSGDRSRYGEKDRDRGGKDKNSERDRVPVRKRALGHIAPQIDDRMRTSEEIHLKLTLTGMPGVGKRRLMRRFGSTEFSGSRINELTRSRLPPMQLYESFIVSLCDNSGITLRHKLAANRSAMMAGKGKLTAQTLLIVFDLTNMDSFSSIAAFVHQKVEQSKNIQWSSLVLIGNKLDLPSRERVVTKRMAMELCQHFGIEFYVEMSAKTAQNVIEILSALQYHYTKPSKGGKGFLW